MEKFTKKQIDDLSDKLQKLYEQIFDIDNRGKKSFDERWKKYIHSKEYKQFKEAYDAYRTYCEYKLYDADDYGDIFTLNDFINDVKNGFLSDYDGYGKYATENQWSDIYVYASDIINNCYRKDFPNVVWFNK